MIPFPFFREFSVLSIENLKISLNLDRYKECHDDETRQQSW